MLSLSKYQGGMGYLVDIRTGKQIKVREVLPNFFLCNPCEEVGVDHHDLTPEEFQKTLEHKTEGPKLVERIALHHTRHQDE